MKNTNALAFISIAAALSELGNPNQEQRAHFHQEETYEEKKIRLNRAEERIKLKRGLKKFYYQGVLIWARNRKNADRKAENKGLI